MRDIRLKVVDEFDKKLYSVSAIDFRNNKISVHFRGNLENVFDFGDIHIIQSTELLDNNKNEVYESDLLSNGVKTFCICYDKSKALYYGVELESNEQIPLEQLLNKKFVVVGNFYIDTARRGE
ncbi:YopX family protein [Paenibacillus sp. FSL K6-3182]|uniref:YopX family protein n=1 Tax=Paenibacillus sp. FSL K6-3182 TaxID=2921495 RepID=UPI0030CBEB76